MFVVPVNKYNEVVAYNVGDTVEIQYSPDESILTQIYSIRRP